MEQRIQILEASFTEMVTRMNAHVIKVDAMMTTVESNDSLLKSSIENVKAATTQATTDSATTLNAQMEAMKIEIGQRVASIEARIQSTETQITKSEMEIIAVQQTTSSMEQEVLRLSSSYKFFEGNVINEVHKIEAKIKEQADQGHGLGGGQTDRPDKPITEYKSINELGKLTNDKTCFRDWK